ncbi:MAG: SDR family oxidoreductase [Verrucomicrobiota bacterium]
MKLESACCVVTGAGRGIGLAIAQALLAEGARVIFGDVDAAALGAAVAATKSGTAAGVKSDVTSVASMAALADEAARRFGPVRVWVNNAGLARHKRIVDYTEAEIDLQLAVNLKGAIAGSQAALRAMTPQRAGHIINIISTASLRGIPTESVYCAAKWGVRGFTQGLREEAAPLGIRVSGVLPGGVDTPFWPDAVGDRPMPVQNFLTVKQVGDAVVALVRMEDSVVPQELVLRALLDRDFSS